MQIKKFVKIITKVSDFFVMEKMLLIYGKVNSIFFSVFIDFLSGLR